MAGRFTIPFILLLFGLTASAQGQRQGVTGVLMGTVTTPMGAPVPHAQITVIGSQDLTGANRLHRHRTDQDGTFNLRLPVGKYWVQAAAVGFQPRWFEEASQRGEALPVVIEEPGAEVVWPVLLHPIASVFGEVADLSTPGKDRIDSGTVLLEGLLTPLRKMTSLVDGRFVAEGLLPGPYRIRVVVAGYVAAQAGLTLSAGENLGPIKVSLSRGLSISGRVMGQTGSPLEGVTVTARPAGSQDWFQAAISDPKGDYVISGLVPGEYTLGATKMGFADAVYKGPSPRDSEAIVRLDQDRSPTQINFSMGQVRSIVGQLVNAEMVPVARARVVAEPVGEGRRQQVRSDDNGHYVLAHVARGSYLVHVFADGYPDFYYPGVQSAADATHVHVTEEVHTDPVNFVLLAGGKIEGWVRDLDSEKPLPGAMVSVRWVDHQGVWQTQADASGRFSVSGLPTGDFFLEV
ncbi:MAG: carboxypeptidase-like regulatory domain-containing protein, partial [bacterium]|nr:carboxypeptidase-like regulatory domain-containing protein [bacterium]